MQLDDEPKLKFDHAIPGNHQEGKQSAMTNQGGSYDFSARPMLPREGSARSLSKGQNSSVQSSRLETTLEKQRRIAENKRLMQQTLDTTNKKFYGVFYSHGKEKPALYSRTSIFCFTDQNPVRHTFVWLMEWNWFENFVTFAILLNSLLLASTDFE
jgi:hypothetical protein